MKDAPRALSKEGSEPTAEAEVSAFSIVRLDTQDLGIGAAFEPYRSSFLRVLSQSYDAYHGDAYHTQRIIDGRSIIYFALADGEVVGVSYVKRNLRRGGTAVRADYRRRGVAEALVRTSVDDFPTQYSILAPSNGGMMLLLLKVGFKRARTIAEVQAVTGDEFQYLSDFVEGSEGIVFTRRSPQRSVNRGMVTLLYRKGDEQNG